MKENFKECLDIILKHEGGFVNHPKDPGGATNLGITKRTLEKFIGKEVTIDLVKNLPKETAARIYKEKYWDSLKGDDLPSGVDLSLFDWGVNSGPARAAKSLQEILSVSADGIIGNQTLAALVGCPLPLVLERIHESRKKFYESLKTFETFGKGWLRRNDETLSEAKRLLHWSEKI